MYYRLNSSLGCVFILITHSTQKTIISFRNRFLRAAHFRIAYTALLLFFISFYVSFTRADAINVAQLTASFLYNFALHVEWPESNKTHFNIALVGSTDKDLDEALAVLQKHKTLLNRPIRVKKVADIAELSAFDLVYLTRQSTVSLQDALKVIEGKPILLVSFEQDNKRLVMLNLIRSEKNTLNFELNKPNLINQGLFPKSELILLGGTEIDVAKLYREGRDSLVKIQKRLDAREAELSKLSTSINELERKNTRLQTQLSNLDSQINEHRKAIEQSENSRKALLIDIEARKNELEIKNNLLNSIGSEITEKEKQLSELNTTIKNQEGEIDTLDDIVGSQQLVLRYLWATVALGFLLVITVFIAYVIKRKDNQKLRDHSQDLQMARDRLVLAKSKAESANEAKSQFLSMMSHELRTPLQAILGYTEVVKEELLSQGDVRYEDDLNRVINNSDRLLKLINDVLDLAKAESGEMKLHISEVKLSTLSQEAIDSLRPQLEKNHNTIHVDVIDGKHLPKSDPEKILHILINLLSNAAKFTENGAIYLSVHHLDEGIYIRVRDEGIGMDSSQLGNIFERFIQVDSSSTRRFQGSGLGLSIVKQFVDLLGGTIDVSSKEGLGTEFKINIPHRETENSDSHHVTSHAIESDSNKNEKQSHNAA